ncbi:MAG: thioesterase family protein [Alphaproteobacteria bacterium]
MSGLRVHTEKLRDEWLDAYGHLNEGYYVVAFSEANWALQEHFDIGVPYFEKTGCALYTLESHIRYLNEVRAPAVLEFESFIFGVDAKKVVIAHRMLVDGTERATFEAFALHYDQKNGGTAPFPDDVLKKLQAACADPLPDWAGASVAIRRK